MPKQNEKLTRNKNQKKIWKYLWLCILVITVIAGVIIQLTDKGKVDIRSTTNKSSNHTTYKQVIFGQMNISIPESWQLSEELPMEGWVEAVLTDNNANQVAYLSYGDEYNPPIKEVLKKEGTSTYITEANNMEFLTFPGYSDVNHTYSNETRTIFFVTIDNATSTYNDQFEIVMNNTVDDDIRRTILNSIDKR